jgi:photosystem II stability/assembly factor-like uncharacterized protein
MKTVGMTRRAAMLGALGLCTQAHAAERLVRALGQSALAVARPTQAVIQAVVRAGRSRRLVAVGERGLAIWSDDDGRSWTQSRVPVRCTLTALRFADDKRGWAVGNLGVVLETEDGGASWTKRLDGHVAADLALQAARAQVNAGKPGSDADGRRQLLLEDAQRLVGEGADKPLLDIALRADGSLLAVGAYGLAFASDDGGRTWRSQIHRLPNPDAFSYYGLAERRGESLLFGEQGLLLRATNPADEFKTQASPSQGSLFGGLALREGPLLLLGLRGKVWRSTERDAAWQAVQTPVDASLIAGTQLADGSALLVGAAGQALQSHDGGQTFQPLALSQRFPFTGVTQADDGALLLVGMRGVLRLSPADLKAAQASGPLPADARRPSA